MAPTVPSSPFAVVGGSGTSAIEFPEALSDPRVRLLATGISVPTPFGDSPPLKHVSIALPGGGGERSALVARMHGWRMSAEHAQAALGLFWAFRKAGVTRVIGESGAGSITQNFRPRDLVVPHDVIDFTPQVGGRIDREHRVLMRDPFCPELRAVVWEGAQAMAAERATRAFDRGIHAATEGTRFETAAEVDVYARLGADLVGAGICPEVFLAREIGACYGALTVVLNYAEGVRPRWDFELLEEIVREDARLVGSLLLDALVKVPEQRGCACAGHRKRVVAADTAAALTDTA